MANEKTTLSPVAGNHKPVVDMSAFAPMRTARENLQQEQRGRPSLSTPTESSREWPTRKELERKLSALS